MLKFDYRYLDKKILSKSFLKKYQKDVNEIIKRVNANTAEGCRLMGWKLTENLYRTRELLEISKKAKQWKQLNLKQIVVIGVGGSYLGAKAAINMVKHSGPEYPEMIFVNNMSANYLLSILNSLKGKKYGIIVISKSGKTLEAEMAFRLFRRQLIENVGVASAKKLIVAITNPEKGTLHMFAKANGYKIFTIPDNIGGRYSSLTPVGIFPMAVAGLDIGKVLKGAKQAILDLSNHKISENHAYLYACLRHYLYKEKKLSIEQFNVYEPMLKQVAYQWQQLFGESEAKKYKALYPAVSLFTNDLHSIGQYLQEGSRNFFETTLMVETSALDKKLKITDDEDGLRYLNNKNLSDLTFKAFHGTVDAHTRAKVNNLVIYISKADEYHYGYLFMWLCHAAYMSAYLLKVNPFDQPGVESYKQKMFELLGKNK